MHNFKTRTLSTPPRHFHYAAIILAILFINLFGIWAMTTLHNALFPGVEAQELLTFTERLPQRTIRLPVSASEPPVEGYDLDKLAKAVARHETCSCTCGNSASRNNCFGIMAWKNGKRYFKAFETKEDSYADFKRIWSTYYKRFPDLALAKRYSGNDKPNAWLSNVTTFYNQL